MDTTKVIKKFDGLSEKLAIIIPAYNCQDTVSETLSSLQNISSGWEYIDRVVICDDGSSDNTVCRIKSTKFDRCRLELLQHDRNKGEAACYNSMLNTLPRSVQWFVILHADDLALDCFIDRNIEIARRCDINVAAVSSNYYVIDKGGEWLAHNPPIDKIIFRAGAAEELNHTAQIGTWWHISGSLVNRTLWEKFGGRDPTLPQLGDWDLMLRWQCNNYAVGHSLIPTTKYRSGASQSLSSRSYLEFRELRERTRIVLLHPMVFSSRLRTWYAGQIAKHTVRRVIKLISIGKIGNAINGLEIGIKCFVGLIRGSKV